METFPVKQKEEEYEQSHVHDVYNSIASHFSQTRYKPWPVVEQFLNHLAPGNVGVDIGCGNGKYLAVRDDLFIMGSDRSDELVKIAKQHERHDASVGDALGPPHPVGRFDFALSIAVLHHLSTRKRRIEGVRAVLELLRSSRRSVHKTSGSGEQRGPSEDSGCGQALFFVWALEQKGSRRGWDEGGEQDVLVPWVMKPSSESSRQGKPENKAKKVSKRKMKGETIEKRQQNGRDEKNDTDLGHSGGYNSSADHPDPDTREKTSVGEEIEQAIEERPPQVYQRYYHLYHQGELEEDIVSAGGEVMKNGYDRDNWWCIARKKIE